MSERKVGLYYAIAGVLLALLVGAASTYAWFQWTSTQAPTQEEPKTVKISWLAPVSLQIPLVASKKGFDVEFGIKFELINIPRASDALTALLGGSLDITFGAFPGVESAYLAGAKVKGMMIAYYGGYKFALVTLNTTGITKVSDLAGKTVAVPGLREPPELFVRVLANMSGIDPYSINLIQQTLADIPSAIATGAVPAGVLFEPGLTSFMNNEKRAVIIARGTNIPVVNFAPGAYFMKENYIKENSTLAYKIFLALAKAQWYIRTTGPSSDEILSILSNATNMPKAVFQPSADKNIWDPRLKPCQVDAAWQEMEFFISMGKLTKTVPISEIWYYGFYERARIEYPELFSDLDGYLQGLKQSGIVTDTDFITDFNEYWQP